MFNQLQTANVVKLDTNFVEKFITRILILCSWGWGLLIVVIVDVQVNTVTYTIYKWAEYKFKYILGGWVEVSI